VQADQPELGALDNPKYNGRTFVPSLGCVVAENPKKYEMPVGSPYCSDPNCRYCKELRAFEEELRRKRKSEPVSSIPESDLSAAS
jgi:hypothetical protein